MSRRSQTPVANLSPREQLLLFATKAHEMSGMRYVRNGMAYTYTIASDKEHPQVRFSADEPDEEDLRSFHAILRQFMTSGPLRLESVLDLCETRLLDDRYRLYLREAREAWQFASDGPGAIDLTVHGHRVTAREVLNLWWNGVLFHTDLAKREKLAELDDLPIPVGRMVLQTATPRLVRVIMYVGDVVLDGLYRGLFTWE